MKSQIVEMKFTSEPDVNITRSTKGLVKTSKGKKEMAGIDESLAEYEKTEIKWGIQIDVREWGIKEIIPTVYGELYIEDKNGKERKLDLATAKDIEYEWASYDLTYFPSLWLQQLDIFLDEDYSIRAIAMHMSVEG